MLSMVDAQHITVALPERSQENRKTTMVQSSIALIISDSRPTLEEPFDDDSQDWRGSLAFPRGQHRMVRTSQI